MQWVTVQDCLKSFLREQGPWGGSIQNAGSAPARGIWVSVSEMLMSWILNMYKAGKTSRKVLQEERTTCAWTGAASRPGWLWLLHGRGPQGKGWREVWARGPKDLADHGVASELTFIEHLQYCFTNKRTKTQRIILGSPSCTGNGEPRIRPPKSAWLQSLCCFSWDVLLMSLGLTLLVHGL